jgi:hypothetical protein
MAVRSQRHYDIAKDQTGCDFAGSRRCAGESEDGQYMLDHIPVMGQAGLSIERMAIEIPLRKELHHQNVHFQRVQPGSQGPAAGVKLFSSAAREHV